MRSACGSHPRSGYGSRPMSGRCFRRRSRDPDRSRMRPWRRYGRHFHRRRGRGRRDDGDASVHRSATRMHRSRMSTLRAMRDRTWSSLEPVGSSRSLGCRAWGWCRSWGSVRGVDERAGRGRGVGAALSSPAAPTGSRSADGGPSWVLVPAMPPVPEPFLLRPRPPRLRRRRGAPVPVEVPAPSDDGAAVASPSAEEDPVVRGASSERRRSALVVAASSAATGLSWFIR